MAPFRHSGLCLRVFLDVHVSCLFSQRCFQFITNLCQQKQRERKIFHSLINCLITSPNKSNEERATFVPAEDVSPRCFSFSFHWRILHLHVIYRFLKVFTPVRAIKIFRCVAEIKLIYLWGFSPKIKPIFRPSALVDDALVPCSTVPCRAWIKRLSTSKIWRWWWKIGVNR